MKNLCLLSIFLFSLVFGTSASALAPDLLLGAGENVRKQDPPGSGTYVALHDAMTADSVQSQFVGHWFHAGWMSHFPAGVGPASCSSGGEWNDLASYQAVLNSGRTLVIFWWFHDDQPCSSSHRADSINTCNDCLVPLLNNLTNGNVVVVLEPEYNNNTTGGLCGGNVIQKDPSWATHLNSLITAVQGAGGAGLNVRVGASPGDFDYANQAYDLNPSLAPAAAAGDFVAFHEIYRSNSGHALPGDTHFGNPSPDQVYHALSYSRFLKKRYSKPLMLGYWTVAPGNYGTAAQADALLDFFENRAQLEANDVELFGPFWYFDDTYPGEGLISSGNVQRPAHAVWRDEANAVISGVDRTQSIGFISPDFGDVLDADSSVNVQWISRGRPNTASTFSLYYQVGSGPVTLIASGLPGDDSSIMSYSWDACAIAPAVDVRLRLVSDLSTEAWSGTFDLTRSSATSNAHHKFDSGTEGWSGSAPDVWTTQGSPVVSAPGSAAFNGTGGLQVTYNHGLDGGWAHIGYEGVRSVSGGNKVTALVYVPFEMNPVTIPGAPVTQAQIHIQWNCGAWPTEDSGTIWLHEGWNEVVLNYTNPSGCGGIAHTEIRFWNKYPGLDGSSVFYVDEVRWGGDLTFSAPGCVAATPTPSFTVSPTPSASPSATPVYSPTHSPTQAPGTATPTPSASPSETPLPSCNAEWNFDDGTVQGWTAQTAALTGITASTAQPYQGSHSLAMTVDFVQPSQNEARMDVSTPSFPRDFTGETLSYWLYVPAGMSDAANPSGATLYVQTGAGWAWHESAWWNIPDSAGWYQISLDMTTVADPDMVQSVGVKVALGGTSPDWSGTIYVDEIGPNPICPTATSTPVGFSPTSTSTSTVSATPTATLTQTPVETLTATPTETTVSDTATATPSVTPADSETATPTSTPVDSLTATPTESPVLPTETVTATNTPQDSPTPTPMLTATATPSVTASFTDTPMVTSTATPSVTASFTESPIASDTASPTVTVTSTNSPISTETATPSPSATLGASFTATPTASVTLTVTPTVTPTATMTMTDTTVPTVMGTATASPTETPSATPSITPTFTPSGCTTWDFEDGLTAGWSRDTVFDTGVKTMAVNATAAYNGSYGLQLGLDLVPSTTDEGGVIYVNGTQNGFPRDYSDGRTLTAWIWVPAGMSQASTPSGAFIYAKTGSGWAWNQGSWTNLPDSAGWVQVSMSMTGVPDNDNVGEIGIKIGLGGGAPAWMGTVYVDDIDDNPAVCGVDTFTATPTSTATPTITFSPTQSPVYSPTMTPVVSATPTATLVSASPTHTPVSGSQGKLKPICIAVNPANPNLPLTVSVELTGVVESLRWRIYSKAHTRIGSGELSGPWGPGWHSVQLPSQPDLASGLYYYVLEGFNGQRSAGRTKAGKLYLLR